MRNHEMNSVEAAAKTVWQDEDNRPSIKELAQFLKVYIEAKGAEMDVPRVGNKVIKVSNGEVYNISHISFNGKNIEILSSNSTPEVCSVESYYENFLGV